MTFMTELLVTNNKKIIYQQLKQTHDSKSKYYHINRRSRI